MSDDLPTQSSTPTPAAEDRVSWRAWCLWLLVGTLAVGTLSILAGLAPPAAKKLVLLPVLFGCVSGLALGFLARELQIPRAGFAAVASALILLAGGIHLLSVSYRQFHKTAAAAAASNPEDAMALSLMEQAAEHDPEIAASLREHRRQRDPQFEDYLTHRVSPLGNWPAPWPALFASGELLLATAAGLYCCRRRVGGGRTR